MVEMALVLPVFLLVAFGAVDFGRVIFTYAELHNAVREGARLGKVSCPDTEDGKAKIKDLVVEQAVGAELSAASVTVSTTGDCVPPTATVTVSATTTFTAVAQTFLGITPITLTASATSSVE